MKNIKNEKEENVYFVGTRNYKYFNMDQAIKNSLDFLRINSFKNLFRIFYLNDYSRDLDKEENFNDEKLCLICYDKYEDNYDKKDKMMPVKLKCGHIFHYDCVYMTYKESNQIVK